MRKLLVIRVPVARVVLTRFGGRHHGCDFPVGFPQ